MGSFYTNVTLRGPGRDQVIAAIRELGYRAFVHNTIAGLTVVCEERSDTQDKRVWHEVANRLSAKLNCFGLAATNHDDDVLLLALYRNGELIDEYDSCPAYWDEDDDRGPLGGNPKACCDALGMPGDPTEVDRVLHTASSYKEDGDEDEFVFATERHEALIGALGWPEVPYRSGFDYLTKEPVNPEWTLVE